MSLSLLEQLNNGARCDINNVAMIPLVSGGLFASEVTLLLYLLLPLRNSSLKKESEMIILA
jgi:hypothetical protein